MEQRAVKQIPFRVTDTMLTLIDEARGDVPRERWLRRAVERALRQHEVAERLRPELDRAREAEPVPTEQPRRRHAPNCKCPVCR